MKGRASVLGLTLWLIAWAAGARAEAPAEAPTGGPAEAMQALERARVCWAALDPECAEEALAIVRAELATLSPEARLEALRISAEVALAGGRTDDARRDLVAILEAEPRFSPRGWPAPWLEALEEAKAVAPDRLPPEVVVSVAEETPPKTALRVEVRAEDRSGIARCELVVAGGARVTLMSADGVVFVGEIARELVRVPAVEVVIEVVDREGNVARWPEVGAHAVRVVAPPKAPAPALTSRWWFWTVIGVAVAAGAVGLAVALDGGGGGEVGASGRMGDLRVSLEEP